MSRFTVIIAVIIAATFTVMPVYAGAGQNMVLPRLRYAVAPDHVRVVLDLPTQAVVTDQSTAQAARVAIACTLTQPPAPLKIDDPIVIGAIITTDADGQTFLTVSLAQPRKCRVFTLPASGSLPFRVVVDVLKTFRLEEQRVISPAITYTRLERQTTDRYLAAHLLQIDASDPHVRFTVSAARRNGETVAAMVQQSGAVCGINGGYFFKGARPVGLLTVEGQILSLPLWQRTAVAFPRNGLPVFGNPTGMWQVILPDGSQRTIADWMNTTTVIPLPDARIVPGISIERTRENPAGVTVVIRNGVVRDRTTMPVDLGPDDFALYLTGAEAVNLGARLPVGAPIVITPVLLPPWANYSHAVGAGPRLLRDGNVLITGDTERFQADVRLGRVARTALGITRDGRVVLLVVEAPGPYGGGATLEELAAELKAYGVRDAMNLDGGGSSSMTIAGEISYPLRSASRPVACSVLVFDDRLNPQNDATTPATADGRR